MLPGQMFRIKDWFSPLPKVNNSLSILKNLGEDSSCSIFWSKKIFGPKKCMVLKNLFSQKNFGPQKIFGPKKIFSPNNLWSPEYLGG